MFAVQHSGMARAGFKQWLTRYVPRPVERSTYVLVATVCLAVLMGFWWPITTTLWNIGAQPWRGLLVALSLAVGHLIFVVATTGYILVTIQLEERDLIRAFGQQYRECRTRVPMLVQGANAGGNWVDEEVVADERRGNTLISSRKPDDLPAFCAKLLEAFSQ